MTVAELIEGLKRMPKDADVRIGVDTDMGFDFAGLEAVELDVHDPFVVWLTDDSGKGPQR